MIIARAASVLVLVPFLGCESAAAPIDEAPPIPFFASAGPVVHHASIGGADICGAFGLRAGCDANFSLAANQYADGSASGQWQDTFVQGDGALHVAVDCLAVHGNQAVVGGVITHGRGLAEGFEGQRAITSVVDNGRSALDPPDQLSFSFFPVAVDCTIDPALFPHVDLTKGQVTVW